MVVDSASSHVTKYELSVKADYVRGCSWSTCVEVEVSEVELSTKPLQRKMRTITLGHKLYSIVLRLVYNFQVKSQSWSLLSGVTGKLGLRLGAIPKFSFIII